MSLWVITIQERRNRKSSGRHKQKDSLISERSLYCMWLKGLKRALMISGQTVDRNVLCLSAELHSLKPVNWTIAWQNVLKWSGMKKKKHLKIFFKAAGGLIWLLLLFRTFTRWVGYFAYLWRRGAVTPQKAPGVLLRAWCLRLGMPLSDSCLKCFYTLS